MIRARTDKVTLNVDYRGDMNVMQEAGVEFSVTITPGRLAGTADISGPGWAVVSYLTSSAYNLGIIECIGLFPHLFEEVKR